MSETKPIIALTFDDGPNTTTTMEVLDRLEKYGVKASFFLIGELITEETKPVIEREVHLGCEINNHSFTHSFMDEMDAEVIRKEISDTSKKITEVCGKQPKFFRPPYIKVNDTMYKNIDMPFICGIGVQDWEKDVTAQQRIEGILSQAVDGAMILLHDFWDNVNTVEALDTVIPELQKRGFTFVTVGELFAAKKVPVQSHPGKLFSVLE